jgi:NADH-quinone oxidoreductase subunit A
METFDPTWIQFKIQYYLYGLIFLIFDVEIVFLFPFAVAYGNLALFAVVEAIIFILILLGGYLYVWRKDALTWQ